MAETNVQTEILTPIDEAVAELKSNDETCNGYIEELQAMTDDTFVQE